jgi:hypothetical protein
MKGTSEDSPLCTHGGHPAEPGERSEPDIQASTPSGGDGWFSVGPLPDRDASRSDIRPKARAGRFGEAACRNGHSPTHGIHVAFDRHSGPTFVTMERYVMARGSDICPL